ncbi:MAG: TMEM175 family protein [Actinomycetota bacterium]|nr:TMEM175 family protein [Actinomycetota bacterium]
MGTSRGFDRLVFFTDAVTAIAITLLILPVVDLVPVYAAHPASTISGFVTMYATQMWSFVLSFVIIGRLWLAHHRLLEPVERQSRLLLTGSLAWAFTIVVLPLPTALIATFHADRTGILFYVGTMTASSLLLSALAWEVYRRPELGANDRQASLMNLFGVGSNAAAFLLALAIGLIFPTIGLYSLLVLLLTIPLDWIVKPRLRARFRNVADTPPG